MILSSFSDACWQIHVNKFILECEATARKRVSLLTNWDGFKKKMFLQDNWHKIHTHDSLCLLSSSHLRDMSVVHIPPPPAHLSHPNTQMQYRGLIRGFSLTITYEYLTNDEIFIWTCLFLSVTGLLFLLFPNVLPVCNISIWHDFRYIKGKGRKLKTLIACFLHRNFKGIFCG